MLHVGCLRRPRRPSRPPLGPRAQIPMCSTPSLASSSGTANPNALNVLGLVLADQGRLADAEKVLQTAIRLRPEGPDAHYTLGVVLEKQGRLLDAQKEFETALRFKPRLILAHRALGAVLQKRGRIAEAQREFKIADDQEKRLRAGAPAGSGR